MMKKKEYIYFPVYNDIALKVACANSFTRDILCASYELFTGKMPSRKKGGLLEGFLIDFREKSIGTKRKIRTNALKFKSFFVQKNNKLFLSTATGSKVTIVYNRRYAQGLFVEGDDLKNILMLTSLGILSYMAMSFRIHAATVKAKKAIFFMIANSNEGKSTLANLLVQSDKGARIIDDDIAFIYRVNNDLRVIPRDFSRIYNKGVTYLLFVEKKRDLCGSIRPISPKEAFKRIVYHADVIFNSKDPLVSYRLHMLGKLVYESKSFILINGKDLKNNPKKTSSLIYSVIRKRNHR